jgi:hypothetical protein
MHFSMFVPGISPTLLNIALPESLSTRSIAAAVTVLVLLSFCATKAAREEVTTRRAMRMNDRANAASWIDRLLSERPRVRRPAAMARGSLVLMPSYRTTDAVT